MQSRLCMNFYADLYHAPPSHTGIYPLAVGTQIYSNTQIMHNVSWICCYITSNTALMFVIGVSLFCWQLAVFAIFAYVFDHSQKARVEASE
jgi:hypothetical protein